MLTNIFFTPVLSYRRTIQYCIITPLFDLVLHQLYPRVQLPPHVNLIYKIAKHIFTVDGNLYVIILLKIVFISDKKKREKPYDKPWNREFKEHVHNTNFKNMSPKTQRNSSIILDICFKLTAFYLNPKARGKMKTTTNTQAI